jgi:hypothetical protein
MKYMLHDISIFEFISNINDTYPIPQSTDISNDTNTTLLENATSIHDN